MLEGLFMKGRTGILVILLATRAAMLTAQQPALAAMPGTMQPMPAAAAAMVIAKRPQPPPKFMTWRRVGIFTLDAAAIAADGYTTQHFMALGYVEKNPLAAAFGSGRGATAGLCAASMAGVVAGTWLAHRRRWRRLEWVLPAGVAAVEAGVVAHNVGLSGGGRARGR